MACSGTALLTSIILPEVLYGPETLSVILSENNRLKVFENRELRRIFRHKREDVKGYRRIIRCFMICTPF
jgi:hypothetical protein